MQLRLYLPQVSDGGTNNTSDVLEEITKWLYGCISDLYFVRFKVCVESMMKKKNISKNRESVGLLSNSHKDVDALFKLDRRPLESLGFFHMSDFGLQVDLVCEGCASRAPCSSTERQGTRALVWKAAPVFGRCCSRNGSRHGGVGVKKL